MASRSYLDYYHATERFEDLERLILTLMDAHHRERPTPARRARREIPEAASIVVRIPTGADYSGVPLEIDANCPLFVEWEAVERSGDEG